MVEGTIILKNNNFHKNGWDIDRCLDEINWRQVKANQLDLQIQSYDGSFKTVHQYNTATEQYTKIVNEIYELQTLVAKMQLDKEAHEIEHPTIIPNEEKSSVIGDTFKLTVLAFSIIALYQIGRYHSFDIDIFWNTLIAMVIIFVVVLINKPQHKRYTNGNK